jgi:hypothetical protein
LTPRGVSAIFLYIPQLGFIYRHRNWLSQPFEAREGQAPQGEGLYHNPHPEVRALASLEGLVAASRGHRAGFLYEQKQQLIK